MHKINMHQMSKRYCRTGMITEPTIGLYNLLFLKRSRWQIIAIVTVTISGFYPIGKINVNEKGMFIELEPPLGSAFNLSPSFLLNY